MKRFPFVKMLMVLAVLFLATACTAAPITGAIATSQAVQIPIELKLGLNAFVLFWVLYGLQWLFDHTKLDLRGIGAALAVSVAEFVILQLQGLIDVVPAAYDLYVNMALYIVLAVLTVLGYVQVKFRAERAAFLFGKRE